jgi:hypothetical protein
MHQLGIDPGNIETAYVIYDDVTHNPVAFDKVPNDQMLALISTLNWDAAAIEMIASYGMPVGKEVFETCLWIGRYIEATKRLTRALTPEVKLVYRKDVKMHLCHSTKAKDSNIRQALMDRYGSTRELALGTKKQPGPLYGFHADVWAALGVAITAAEGGSNP